MRTMRQSNQSVINLLFWMLHALLGDLRFKQRYKVTTTEELKMITYRRTHIKPVLASDYYFRTHLHGP
jgi:hypothetical protein